MESSNVSRLIVISTIGVGNSRVNMSFVSKWLYPLIVGKARLEEAQKQENSIIKSHLQWTIIRPPRLMSTGKLKSVKAETYLATTFFDVLEREDLADFMIGALEKNEYIQQALTIVNR